MSNRTCPKSIMLLVTVMALVPTASASRAAAPDRDLLRRNHEATMDLMTLADVSLSEQPTGTWPPQIRYALFYLTHYEISSRIGEEAKRGSFENPDHVLKFNIMFADLAVRAGRMSDAELLTHRDEIVARSTRTWSSEASGFRRARKPMCWLPRSSPRLFSHEYGIHSSPRSPRKPMGASGKRTVAGITPITVRSRAPPRFTPRPTIDESPPKRRIHNA